MTNLNKNLIRALIIDDEEDARELLQGLISMSGEDVEILDKCPDAKAGRAAIRKHQPDLVFLDIQMPGENGFQMLEKLPELEFNVIFTTAYDQYAIKAFKVAAVDYLLKPVDPDELADALSKVIKNRENDQIQEKLRQLILAYAGSGLETRISIPGGEEEIFVDCNDIVRVEADNNYTTIHFSDGSKTLISKTIKFFEDTLPNSHFIRVHRSHIINVFAMKSYSRIDGGQIGMSDGSRIPVSRRRKSAFRKRLEALRTNF